MTTFQPTGKLLARVIPAALAAALAVPSLKATTIELFNTTEVSLGTVNYIETFQVTKTYKQTSTEAVTTTSTETVTGSGNVGQYIEKIADATSGDGKSITRTRTGYDSTGVIANPAISTSLTGNALNAHFGDLSPNAVSWTHLIYPVIPTAPTNPVDVNWTNFVFTPTYTSLTIEILARDILINNSSKVYQVQIDTSPGSQTPSIATPTNSNVTFSYSTTDGAIIAGLVDNNQISVTFTKAGGDTAEVYQSKLTLGAYSWTSSYDYQKSTTENVTTTSYFDNVTTYTVDHTPPPAPPSVPDQGATLVLLGAALGGLGFLRRRKD